MQFEEMAEIKQEVDSEGEDIIQFDASSVIIKQELNVEEDYDANHMQGHSAESYTNYMRRVGAVGQSCYRGRDVLPAYSNMDIIDSELHNNDTRVTVSRRHQSITRRDMSRQPVGTDVTEGQADGDDDDDEFTEPPPPLQLPGSVSGKSSELCELELTCVGVSDERAQQVDEKLYPCSLCGLSFTDICDFSTHLRKHQEKRFDIHGHGLAGDGDLDVCTQVAGGQQTLYSCADVGVDFTTVLMAEEQPCVCEVCDLKFPNRSSLEEHGQSVHNADRPYKCDFCGLAFSSVASLRRHVLIHTGEKPYNCDICPARFTRNFSLKIHKRIHTGHKPYKCSQCSQEFTNSGCLKRHSRTHTGEKKYKCDTCGIRYAFQSYLKIHKRTHTGEKPYKCEVCGLEFTDNRCLKRHSGIHTGLPTRKPAGEKKFKCDVCDAKFAFQGNLKVHQRVHTGEKAFKCDICQARFSYFHTMKEHQRIHTGDKPYVCHVCDVGFTYKSHLTRHVITHTGERPYKCDICDMKFTQSSSLNRHKGVHKEKIVM